MGKKLFVVADIHGHYTEMVKALNEVGFDEKNEDHIFVSCGDIFDRGKENALVYDFVRGLQRKILIRGNHDDNLRDILERGSVTDMDVGNCTDITVKELIGEDALAADGRLDRNAYAAKITEITEFIDLMSDYYETEKYVFTHGWLPITFKGRRPCVSESWRSASKQEWEEARLLEWQQLYDAGALLEGKIIVCGHRSAVLGHMFDSYREPDCSEPFYGDGMIAIDAGTIRSHRVNVLVLEEF